MRASTSQPLMVAAVALLLIVARMPERVIDGFLWAEDGKVFLRDAYALGAASILHPYAQYLHLLPRLVAWLVARFCYIDQVARPLAWICALMLGATCAYLFTFARKRFSLPTAWAFALAPLLVPHTGEVWLTITNLQWVAAPALLLLLWEAFRMQPGPARSPGHELARATAIVILTLTGPFGLIFSPLVALRLAATRSIRRPRRPCRPCRPRLLRRTWAALGAYVAAAGLQLATILGNPPPAFPPGIPSRAPFGAYLHFPWQDQFLHYLALDFVLPWTWTDKLGAGWKIAAIGVALLLAACLLLAGRAQRRVAGGLFAVAAGLWMLCVLRLGIPDMQLRWNMGGRYFYVSFIAMAWSLLIVRETAHRPGARALAGLVLAMVLVNSIVNYPAAMWQHADLAYREDAATWVLRVPPTPDWYVPVPPAWKSP